ncbi:MAG: glycosyltransferase family 9 protein [Planctomycetota bacterium]|jgi:ADP-heptose:LPS heptosyltransferase
MIDDPEKILEARDAGRIRKILLIRISRLGDLVFTTPAVRCLKAQFPGASFHFLTNSYSSGVLEGNPYVDRVLLMNRKSLLWRFFRIAPVIPELKREQFDLAILFRWRKEFRTLLRKIRVPYMYRPYFFEQENGTTHQADRIVKGLAALGVEPDRLGMEVYFSAEDEAAVQGFIEEKGMGDAPRVVLHAGCHQVIKSRYLSGPAKRVWPLYHWFELVRILNDRLEAPPILVGASEGDQALNQQIIERSGLPCPEFVITSVNRLAALLGKSQGFVCVDTGPLHVASAVNVPTAALFGPSRPALTGPYRNRGGSEVFQKTIPCVPCKGKGVKCDNNICMQLITPEEVAEALLERLMARKGRKGKGSALPETASLPDKEDL